MGNALIGFALLAVSGAAQAHAGHGAMTSHLHGLELTVILAGLAIGALLGPK